MILHRHLILFLKIPAYNDITLASYIVKKNHCNIFLFLECLIIGKNLTKLRKNF